MEDHREEGMSRCCEAFIQLEAAQRFRHLQMDTTRAEQKKIFATASEYFSKEEIPRVQKTHHALKPTSVPKPTRVKVELRRTEYTKVSDEQDVKYKDVESAGRSRRVTWLCSESKKVRVRTPSGR